jgi:hypothetical protein
MLPCPALLMAFLPITPIRPLVLCSPLPHSVPFRFALFRSTQCLPCIDLQVLISSPLVIHQSICLAWESK